MHVVSEKSDAEHRGVKVSKPQVLQNPEDRADFFVRLRVRATQENCQVDVTVAGRFRLQGEEPSAAVLRMVEYNAPSILFGIVRGFVASVTALTEHGKIELPSVNLAELVEG